ncbi:MAG TPA: deoxyribodipyrimidine photo-lyase, partial [Tepidisphaeraceae bacterium]|nr:deoxyribodipyrimidine photo-lyase [Tepidisphaeraceae bacterium]
MVNIVWFRRDFRLHDNTALWHAAKASGEGAVQPVFVFDDEILRHPDTGGAVVSFMLGCLESLREAFAASGVSMRFLHGPPSEQLPLFANAMGARAVYFNKDYHPAAIARDDEVTLALSRAGVEVRSFKDQVIYEERELLAASTGEAYTVYTPYARAWRAKLAAERDAQAGPKLWDAPKLRPFNVEPTLIRGLKLVDLYTTADLGFDPPPALSVPRGEAAARAMLRRWCSGPIKDYAQSRNFPADEDGTSKVSAHLRHGTLSPRQCVRAAMYVRGKSTAFSDGADKWIGELIWREFYQQILFNFPSVVDQPFKAKLANLKWR